MPMPIRHALAIAFCLAAICRAAPGAQNVGISAKFHPWGQFKPGAWKTVRVVTETLNEQGQVVSTSTTDTKTTLVDLDHDGVTLEIQTCMEVAGKRFEAEPQTVKQGFHGELLGAGLQSGDSTAGEVTIEGKKIPCQVQQWQSDVAGGKNKTTIYYSAEVPPYILKRESILTDAEGKNELSRTLVEVIALNMPVMIRSEQKNGVYVKTALKNANGSVSTLAAVLPEVPGGVVSSSSKELDAQGRLVRRSTLELIDFNEDPSQDRTGIFGRKRPPRHRGKSSSRGAM